MKSNTLPQGKVIIVALEINKKRDHAKYVEYDSGNPKEKIKKISHRIEALCKELQAKEKDAMWIIGWPEYGVTGDTTKAVSDEIKKEFKKELQKLTAQFPNLVIFGGTVSSMKKYSDKEEVDKNKKATKKSAQDKLEEIKQYYDEEPIVNYVKKVTQEDDTNPIEQHLGQVLEAQKEQKDEIFVNRNILYISQGGKIIQRHDKTAPRNETYPNTVYTNSVFQPGKGSNANPIVKINHPITNEEILVGTSICQEFNLDVVKFVSPKNPPLFHFVFSDFVKLKFENLDGNNLVVQFDTRNDDPRLICLNEEFIHQMVQNGYKHQDSILLYRNNLLLDDKKLSGPIRPMYAFEFRVVTLFNDAIQNYPNNKALQDIKSVFQQLCEKYSPDYKHATRYLTEALKLYNKELKIGNSSLSGFFKPKDAGKGHQSLETYEKEYMKKFYDNLIQLIKENKQEYKKESKKVVEEKNVSSSTYKGYSFK